VISVPLVEKREVPWWEAARASSLYTGRYGRVVMAGQGLGCYGAN
jgi:hypothetical protein